MAWEPRYTTVDELSSYLRIDDSADDMELAAAIDAASRSIDHVCNRQFGQVDAAEERTYVAYKDYGRDRWVIDIDDLMDDTGLTVTVDGDTVTTYNLNPRNASQKGLPWTRLVFTDDSEHKPDTDPHEVVVDALWGWTVEPGEIQQAALLQAARFYARRFAPMGVAGSPEVGSEIRLLHRVDPDVAVILRTLRRTRSVG